MSVKLGFEISDLIKSGKITQQEIDDLQKSLKQEKIGTLTDQQVAQFIISCDKDLKSAKKAAVAYVRMKGAAPELFLKRRLEDHDFDAACSISHFNIIPKRTKNNHVVLVFRLHDSDYKKYSTPITLNLFVKMISAAIYKYPSDGLILISDMEALSARHLLENQLRVAMTFLKYCQEALPVKLRAFHYINASYFTHKILLLIKPLLKKSVRSMIYTHAASFDREEFSQKYIEKDCLPSNYGGNLPSTEELHIKTLEFMKSLRSFYDEEEEQINDLYKFFQT